VENSGGRRGGCLKEQTCTSCVKRREDKKEEKVRKLFFFISFLPFSVLSMTADIRSKGRKKEIGLYIYTI
jgi:hypothetical protein